MRSLDLRGCVITEDAILTQHTIWTAIEEAGGDYGLPVKANQATRQRAMAEVFWSSLTPHHHAYLTADQTYNCQAGHVEWRILTATSTLNDYVHYLQWR